jgi:hypothetical protein
LEGFGEIPRADTPQVQPGDQLVEALGPTQIGRQDLTGEPDPFAFFIDPPVVHPRRLDLYEPQTRLNLTRGQVAVANHQSVPLAIPHLGVATDVFGDLILNGLGQHPLGSLP